MEIKNKQTVTRGEGEEDNREKGGRVKSRNMYDGPMNKDNEGGGLNVGGGRWVGQRRVMVEKIGTTVTE